jgi:hypothetical protein
LEFGKISNTKGSKGKVRMRVLSRESLAGSLVVLALLSACSDKKSFAGGTPAGAVVKTDDAEPATPDPEPEPSYTPEVETKEIFKDCETSASSVFMADLYKLPVDTKRLPDFPSLEPIKKICLKQIDIATREWSEGFPGVLDLKEWFALNIHFNLKVVTAGDYEFSINSDDGSKLIIDGVAQPVIDHDGQHGPAVKNGKVYLKAGNHKVNLQYFQGPANQIALELFWIPPGGSKEYIPTKYVTRDNSY